MNNITQRIISLIAVFLSFNLYTIAANEIEKRIDKEANVTKKYKPGELRKKLDDYMGGIVEKQGSGKGWICIMNGQTILPEMKLFEYTSILRRNIKLETKVQKLEEPFSLAKALSLSKATGANATLFIIEDNELPFSFIAPDSGWGVVNVKAISAEEKLKGVVQERIKKAILRAYSILCGAYDSGMAGNILNPVSSAEDYDALQNPALIPPTLGNPICIHMSKRGMKPIIFSSYRRACEAGWAEPPTNAIQQAVWDDVKAKQAQVPTRPIKITPDMKPKGK